MLSVNTMTNSHVVSGKWIDPETQYRTKTWTIFALFLFVFVRGIAALRDSSLPTESKHRITPKVIFCPCPSLITSPDACLRLLVNVSKNCWASGLFMTVGPFFLICFRVLYTPKIICSCWNKRLKTKYYQPKSCIGWPEKWGGYRIEWNVLQFCLWLSCQNSMMCRIWWDGRVAAEMGILQVLEGSEEGFHPSTKFII